MSLLLNHFTPKWLLLSCAFFGLWITASAQEGGLTDEKVKVEEVTADQQISQRLEQMYSCAE